MQKNYSILINLIIALFIFSACEDTEDINLKTSGVLYFP